MAIDLGLFGVIVAVNARIEWITPPCRGLLIIIRSITGAQMSRIARDLPPFPSAPSVAPGTVTLVPDFGLWLPRWLEYKG